jgi:hypothetical protein
MPGKMDNNLRRAFLQEELGVYLLRGLAAVAPVPRPEDTGIDAIATLLRRDSSRQLTAEKSFYVQLKAVSVKTVEYNREQVRWLSELRLPMFIGSVDPKDSSLSLFTCHRALVAAYEGPFESMKLCVSPAKREETGWLKVESIDNDPLKRRATIWLGTPVLKWTPSDIARSDFLQNSFAVLSPLLECEDNNIRWRRIRFFGHLNWTTGTPATISRFDHAAHGLDGLAELSTPKSRMHFLEDSYKIGLHGILQEITPYLRVWASHCISTERKDEWQEINKIIALLRKKGVNLDSDGFLADFAKRKFG